MLTNGTQWKNVSTKCRSKPGAGRSGGQESCSKADSENEEFPTGGTSVVRSQSSREEKISATGGDGRVGQGWPGLITLTIGAPGDVVKVDTEMEGIFPGAGSRLEVLPLVCLSVRAPISPSSSPFSLLRSARDKNAQV